MKTPRIINAVGHIDDDLITTAQNEKKKHNRWIKWSSVAACFAVIIIAGAAVLPSVLKSGSTRYKKFYVQEDLSAIVWPWEYQPIYEKYTQIEIDGVSYRSRGAVSGALVGERIGTYTVTGYDMIKDETHSITAEAYKMNNIAQNQFVAVMLEGNSYVFKNDIYNPHATLGELMSDIDLPAVIELNRFSENADTPDNRHLFTLNDDDYIWQVLSECGNAPFVENHLWNTVDKEYLSFTITSEALGVYKNAMYITTDGYLWTNIFGWQYLFYIGETSAEKIITYAMENCEKSDYEPYMNTLVGTAAEITEEYILIDDSILCKDPKDGISYTIPLNDIRISRYVDYGIISEGDTVLVSYTGEIDTADKNTIDSAVQIDKATIRYQKVFIFE